MPEEATNKLAAQNRIASAIEALTAPDAPTIQLTVDLSGVEARLAGIETQLGNLVTAFSAQPQGEEPTTPQPVSYLASIVEAISALKIINIANAGHNVKISTVEDCCDNTLPIPEGVDDCGCAGIDTHKPASPYKPPPETLPYIPGPILSTGCESV